MTSIRFSALVACAVSLLQPVSAQKPESSRGPLDVIVIDSVERPTSD